MIAALVWKEWREQGWRMALAVFVLATMAASLVRAQLVPMAEAVLVLFGPIGLALAVFLSMGSVATERADGTWSFLVARPVARVRVLLVKWAFGAVSLATALLLAGVAAHLAAASHGYVWLAPPPPGVAEQFGEMLPQQHTVWWLWGCVGASTVALLGLYTAMFFVLTRARDELHAGLGGVLLVMVALAWAAQYAGAYVKFTDDWGAWGAVFPRVLWVSALLNPLSPLVFVREALWVRALAVVLTVSLWILLPVMMVVWRARRGETR